MMKNGFATCGLAPFSPENFTYTILQNESNTANETNVCQSRDVSFGEHRKNFENLENVMGEFPQIEFEHGNIAVENEGLYRIWLQYKQLSAGRGSNIESL